jgi:hypothetical protein
MISKDTISIILAFLLLFSLPICMMIFLFNAEVMPNINKYGITFEIICQIIHIMIVSTVLGVLIEVFFAQLYELFFK